MARSGGFLSGHASPSRTTLVMLVLILAALGAGALFLLTRPPSVHRELIDVVGFREIRIELCLVDATTGSPVTGATVYATSSERNLLAGVTPREDTMARSVERVAGALQFDLRADTDHEGCAYLTGSTETSWAQGREPSFRPAGLVVTAPGYATRVISYQADDGQYSAGVLRWSLGNVDLVPE